MTTGAIRRTQLLPDCHHQQTSCVSSFIRDFLLSAGLCKAQAAGIKFTHRLKIRFSPHMGNSLN